MSQPNAVYSTMIRAGRTTYFVDVREGKNGKRFVAITESRLDQHDARSRHVIRVQQETLPMVIEALKESESAC